MTMNQFRQFLLSDRVEKVVGRPGFMKWAIAGFIVVNMITRPVIVMLDRGTPKKDRAFSAERLAFQELLSLGCHLGIASSFERLGAWLGSRYFKGDPHGFQKSVAGKVYNLADWKSNVSGNGWKAFLNEKAVLGKKLGDVGSNSALRAPILKQMEAFAVPPLVSGSMRVGSIAGTILALGVVAPWLNNLTLPFLVKGVDAVLGKATNGRLQLSPNETTPVGKAPSSVAPSSQQAKAALNVVSQSPHLPKPDAQNVFAGPSPSLPGRFTQAYPPGFNPLSGRV